MNKKDLYRGCYLAQGIQIGDKLPITSPVFDEKGFPQLGADVCVLDASVHPLLDQLHKIYRQINTDKYKQTYQDYFTKHNIDVPVDIFLPCFAVLIARKKVFNDLFADEDRAADRANKYINRKRRDLAEILQDKEMMCGEYAAVIQLFFQELKLDSEMFCGMRFAPTKEGKPDQDAEPHTFLILKDQKQQRYVFDETLDRCLGKGVYPVIRKIPLSDQEWQDFLYATRPQNEGGHLGVFPATDIFNKHVQYYGVKSSCN